MSKLHATVLREIAPQVAQTFRTDPEVAELLDPAVFIGASEDDSAAAVVERLQLAEVIRQLELFIRAGLGLLPARFSLRRFPIPMLSWMAATSRLWSQESTRSFGE